MAEKSKLTFPSGISSQYGFNQYLFEVGKKAKEEYMKKVRASKVKIDEKIVKKAKEIKEIAIKAAIKKAGVKSDYWEGLR